MDTVTIDKRIQVYPNQKLWMTREVRTLLKERNKAFRCGDGAQYSAATASLRRSIREAKTSHQRRIAEHLSSNNTRQVWQGVQHIISYKSNGWWRCFAGGGAEHLLCSLWGGATECSHITPLNPWQHPHIGGTWGAAHTKGGEPEESCWPRWRNWTCTKDLCRPAGCCLYQDLQPLPVLIRCATLSEDFCYCSTAKKGSSQVPERLPLSGTYTDYYEVLWNAGSAAHHVKSATCIGLSPDCLQG